MNDDLLIQRYLDHQLSAEEVAALSTRLREDADLRAHLREIAVQALVMGDLARASQARASQPQKPRQVRFRILSPLALAASVALLATSAWLWFGAQETPVLTLTECSGSLTWSHGGDLMEEVPVGQKLAAGTLETVGEASNAVLRFADGTFITLAGETELSFSEDGQKRLVLRRGSFSAQVRPQTPGRPMLVRTPSAEAEVLGTVFHLSTRPDDTLLKVAEGRVKLKRLSDGSSVEVPAQSSAVASFDSTAALHPAVTPEPLTTWSFDFINTMPPQSWRGIWHGGPGSGRMVASPYVAKKQPDGTITTHFGVSIRTAQLNPPLQLLAAGSSVIRYRFKLDKKVPLQLMLLTNKPNGDFGGNFECKIGADKLQPDAEGWCDIAVPLSRYRVIDPRPHLRKRFSSPAGNVITSAIINTLRTDAGLTVARFSLDEDGRE